MCQSQMRACMVGCGVEIKLSKISNDLKLEVNILTTFPVQQSLVVKMQNVG